MSTVPLFSSASQELSLFDGEPVSGSDGRQQPRIPSQFQFSTLPKPKVGYQSRRSCDRDSRCGVGQDQDESNSVHRVFQCEDSDGNRGEYEGDGAQSACFSARIGNGCLSAQPDHVTRGGLDERDSEPDWMESEDGGEVAVAF